MLRKIVLNSGIYGVAEILARLVTFLSIPVFANLLSIEQFGELSLAASAASLVAVIMSVGVNNSVQRFYWETEPDQRSIMVGTALLLLFGSVLLIGLMSYVIVEFASQVLATNSFLQSTGLFAAALLSASFNLVTQFCLDFGRLLQKALSFALFSLIKSVFALGVSFLLLEYTNWGVYAVFAGETISYAIMSSLMLFYIRSNLKFTLTIKYLSKILRFGFPFIFTGLAYWVFTFVDRWMLMKYSSIEEVGLFSLAARYSGILILLSSVFGQVWGPMMMKMRSESENFHEKVEPVVNVWILLVAFVGCGLSLFSEEIVMFSAPAAYANSSSPLRFLMIAMAIAGTTQVTTIGISLARKSQYLAIGSWITAGINLVLNFILVPRFGSSGAAFATLASYLFLTTFYYKISVQHVPIRCRIDVVVLSVLVLATGLIGGWLKGAWTSSYHTILYTLLSKSVLFVAIGAASGIYLLRKEKVSLQEFLLRLQKNA